MWRKFLHFIWPPSQTLKILPGEMDKLMLLGVQLETAFKNNAGIWTCQGRLPLDHWMDVTLPAGRWERNFVFSCAEVDPDGWSFLESWCRDQRKNAEG